MKRVLFILSIVALSFHADGQKSRVLSVFQMIDQGKYEEAKEAIELAVWNEKTSRWPRTYYARGVLCQTAFEDGYKKKDKKKTAIYPDQLYVAYDSYEKALELDRRGRLQTAVSQKYYHLSNDFRKLGKDHFDRKQFERALRAFEQALLVSNSKLVNAKVDTSLVYNTAIAAYESENWEKAIGYLTGLHDNAFRPSTCILLYQAHLETGDSASAMDVLLEGRELYNHEEQIVMRLVNLYEQNFLFERAINVLDEAIDHRPENHKYLWGKGLIYIKMDEYDKAIESLRSALEIIPAEPKICYHLGVIYFNKGIDLREASLKIRENDEYIRVKNESRAYFLEAVTWLEKSYGMDPSDEQTISTLHQLYFQLQMREKEASMRKLID